MNVTLNPDRSLLNPHFETYRLDLNKPTVVSFDIPTAFSSTLADNEFSFQHVKAFGGHNHLQFDPWNPHIVYYAADNGQLMQVVLTKNAANQLDESVLPRVETAAVWRTPPPANHTGSTLPNDRRAVSCCFLSEELALMSHCGDQITIFKTPNRSQATSPWEILWTGNPVDDVSFCLCDAHLHRVPDSSKLVIECIVMSVHQAESAPTSESSPATKFLTCLHWLRFESVQDTFVLTQCSCARSASAPDFVALEHAGPGGVAHIFSSKLFSTSCSANDNESDTFSAEAKFTWMQTDEEGISIDLPLPTTFEVKQKEHIKVIFKSTVLVVSFFHEENQDWINWLEGELYAPTKANENTWTWDGNRLDIHLFKANSSDDEDVCGTTVWPFLFTNGNAGGCQIFPESLKEPLDDENNLDSCQKTDPFYNKDIEECDQPDQEDAFLYRLNFLTGERTHTAYALDHPPLFTGFQPTQAGHEPQAAVCLPHDVDGLLWSPTQAIEKSTSVPWRHVRSYPALAYVLASKQNDRKFVLPSWPSHRYVCLVEAVSLLFLYYQPEALEVPDLTDNTENDESDQFETHLTNELRNRKTGAVMKASSVAKQQVIRLPDEDENNQLDGNKSRRFILGCVATDDYIIILKRQRLYIVKLQND